MSCTLYILTLEIIWQLCMRNRPKVKSFIDKSPLLKPYLLSCFSSVTQKSMTFSNIKPAVMHLKAPYSSLKASWKWLGIYCLYIVHHFFCPFVDHIVIWKILHANFFTEMTAYESEVNNDRSLIFGWITLLMSQINYCLLHHYLTLIFWSIKASSFEPLDAKRLNQCRPKVNKPFSGLRH